MAHTKCKQKIVRHESLKVFKKNSEREEFSIMKQSGIVLKSALKDANRPSDDKKVTVYAVQENIGSDSEKMPATWTKSGCASMRKSRTGPACGYAIKLLPPNARAPIVGPWLWGSEKGTWAGGGSGGRPPTTVRACQ